MSRFKKKNGYFPFVEIFSYCQSSISDAHNSTFFFPLKNVSAFTADTTQGARVVGTFLIFFFLRKG